MKKVITYGTFDLLHRGHINLLQRAKALGDFLVVGVTSEMYDQQRGKLNVSETLVERLEAVKSTGLADQIIIEEYQGQKIDDIQRYNIDIFAIGSDWKGKFDYIKDYCEVVYLERTRGISSTMLRGLLTPVVRMAVIGSGRIAGRFISESKYVSGVEVEGVYNPKKESAKIFAQQQELRFYSDYIEELWDKIDAVYIASPHLTHFAYAKAALEAGKHVLCEKPITLCADEARELYDLAAKRGLVLLEALKTAYCPAFNHLIYQVKSGAIGEVKDVDASFTKLVSGDLRELDYKRAGGSMTELASYALLPVVKLLGIQPVESTFYSYKENNIDLFTRAMLVYPSAVASIKVGLGVKTEGQLIISGTKGYALVPAPWWKTELFSLCYENINSEQKYFYKFNGDGLRYELSEFLSLINNQAINTYKLMPQESIAIVNMIEQFLQQQNRT